MASGGARPQTAEIIKTFGQRCPQVVTNNIQTKADYIVLLDHEGGKGFISHKNKVAVFTRVTGDSVVSKSTVSLGGSVQDACEAIKADWAVHGAALRAASSAPAAAPAAPPAPAANAAPPIIAAKAPPASTPSPAPATSAAATGKLSISSNPDGADIEIDGNFVGNAPSTLQIAEGDHTVAVKKGGFKDWERKLKVSAGSDVHLSADLEKVAASTQ